MIVASGRYKRQLKEGEKMKKLMLLGAMVAVLVVAAAPAFAQIEQPFFESYAFAEIRAEQHTRRRLLHCPHATCVVGL